MHIYNKETKTKTGGPEEYMRVVLKTLNSQVPLTLTISKCLCVQVCFPFFFSSRLLPLSFWIKFSSPVFFFALFLKQLLLPSLLISLKSANRFSLRGLYKYDLYVVLHTYTHTGRFSSSYMYRHFYFITHMHIYLCIDVTWKEGNDEGEEGNV